MNNPTEGFKYDFKKEENAAKWNSLFIESLSKVQKQVHTSLQTKEDGLKYIESLIIQLLGMLCASQPHTVADVEERVSKTFPHPIEKWAIGDANAAIDKGKKKNPLVLPVDKIHTLLVKDVLGYKIDYQVTVYVVAVLEYIAADILKLTGNYVKNIKHDVISLQDIKIAMCADKVLMDMFFQDDDDDAYTITQEPPIPRRASLTYAGIVKDLVLEENQYIRELNMIIKVFREPFARLFHGSKDLENIFSNITDIHEQSLNFLSSLEDIIEMTDENETPLLGGWFEELAEGQEFDMYEKYAIDILRPTGKDRLHVLMQRQDAQITLTGLGKGFVEAVKYLLPKLLIGPIYHCLHYFNVLQHLIDLSQVEEDRDILDNAYSVFHRLKVELEKKLQSANINKSKFYLPNMRYLGRADRDAVINKMNDLQKSIDGWEGKNIGQSSNKFIMEGMLYKVIGKRLSERYVFLFDGIIIFVKQNTKRTSVTGPVAEYKFKEKFNIRKIDIVEKEDTEEIKNAFDLQIRHHGTITLAAKSQEDKANWMASLISLIIGSMLERLLDSLLTEEEKKHKLDNPTPEQYRFAEPDVVGQNIVFEEKDDRETPPLIKGGSILKLVERLTYHLYADPKFVKTFLTTYRSFCKPMELLDLLIERFHIPDPPVSHNLDNANPDSSLIINNQLKKFRNDYAKPVQFRVLNVLRHWVDQHWYDFELNEGLLEHLHEFLESVKGKDMKKWVESITKIINRKKDSSESKPRQITFIKDPPKIEWHLAKEGEEDKFDLMTLHPIEIARQVTLLEFDLYRAVKPSEMVGSVWIKKNKSITSPNLLRMIDHSTRFTFWLEKCIIESMNFEERVFVLSRILEIMMVFYEYNNFNGVLEVVSALNSAPVFRLEHTFAEISQKNHKLIKAFDEAKELSADHFKKYYEKLRSINPPCVPFLGNYLTNILLTEEGNPDVLTNLPGIINFSKRRKVAEITAEIQQYQNQPYCLNVQTDVRYFFERLDPLGAMSDKEFNDDLYAKSLEIEPRNSKQPTKFPKKYEYSLQSPGIKLSKRQQSSTSSRNPMALHSTTSTTTLHENTELDSVTIAPTPPGSPLTPTSNDNSVFGMVELGGHIPRNQLPDAISIASMRSIAPSDTTSIRDVSTNLPPDPKDIPPPLPPRIKRTVSSSSEQQSPVSLEPPPPLPSWEPLGADGPPPVPPRSVPRQSVSMETVFSRQSSHHVNVNPGNHGNHGNLPGGVAVIPQVPPRTYRGNFHHTREHSS